MLVRTKHSPKGPSRPPEPPWLVGAMIGLSISSMAAGAIALGTGMAITKVITRGG